jgi:phosphinothricin acetyltransferase
MPAARTTDPPVDHPDLAVEPLGVEHWPAVREIYAEGLLTGHASFETEPPSWEDFRAGHLPDHQLVAHDDREVLGWAALSPVSDRCAYQGVAEDSVYVAERARGRGVARYVLTQLVLRAEESGIWTVQAGIFPENTASVALHHACNFRTVGIRERLGKYHGVWRDVLLLERRSGRIM